MEAMIHGVTVRERAESCWYDDRFLSHGACNSTDYFYSLALVIFRCITVLFRGSDVVYGGYRICELVGTIYGLKLD